MTKAIQILQNGIDTLKKSMLFSDDENYKEMITSEIAEYQEAIDELNNMKAIKKLTNTVGE